MRESERQDGWAYLVSGTVALGASIPGYFLSDDVFAKVVYTAGQTLGVASVGYGSYLLLVDDEYTRFSGMLRSVRELSGSERDRLAGIFFRQNAVRARRIRTIRIITHSLTAGLNFLNAATVEHRELRTAQIFLGGINLLAVGGLLLGESEEEALAGQVASVELTAGRGLSLVFRF